MVGETTSVGNYPKGASPYGVLDMTGNVKELCKNWLDNYNYENSPRNNPKGSSSGYFKAVRGSDWKNGPGILRAYIRGCTTPFCKDNGLGFRLARTP